LTQLNKDFKSAILCLKGKELSLNALAFTELLKTILDKGLDCRFQAKGFSMFPFIRSNDIVTVSPLREKAPKLGDVVAFIKPENKKLVIHRVIGKKDGYFIIRGDNPKISNNDSISLKDIIGRVKQIERNEKKISLGLGPEQLLIAHFSRFRISVILVFIWKIIPRLIRKRVL